MSILNSKAGTNEVWFR